jgi:hypothetical protein
MQRVAGAESARAWMPCAPSTSSSTPSHADSERDTSYEKSTWPGVSMRLNRYSPLSCAYTIDAEFACKKRRHARDALRMEAGCRWMCARRRDLPRAVHGGGRETAAMRRCGGGCRWMRTLMVMPRSRSTCSLSSSCACLTAPPPPLSSSLSASVDLPWSMCAMMPKLRIRSGGNRSGE